MSWPVRSPAVEHCSPAVEHSHAVPRALLDRLASALSTDGVEPAAPRLLRSVDLFLRGTLAALARQPVAADESSVVVANFRIAAAALRCADPDLTDADLLEQLTRMRDAVELLARHRGELSWTERQRLQRLEGFCSHARGTLASAHH